MYLIDGKANGVEVASKASLPASILLHQTDEDGAAFLTVVRIVVHVVQADEELRVGAEGGCRETSSFYLNALHH